MPRVRLLAKDRRILIVDAAFALLAASGFEGLRTRDVAVAAKINSATLHHYFPTKEDLVVAIAERLAERFTTEHAPPLRGKGARTALRQQFADVTFYCDHRPELLAVYRELAVRALRDEPTRILVERVDERWRDSVEALLRLGKNEGVFRSDLEPAAAASLVVAALWGAVAFRRISPAAFKRMCDELESGLRERKG
jgi:AcrR family transcriptional regulator